MKTHDHNTIKLQSKNYVYKLYDYSEIFKQITEINIKRLKILNTCVKSRDFKNYQQYCTATS